MFIRKLTTKNYRTLEDFEVTFLDYYTAVCGKNDSGKSNLTRMIRFLMSSQPDYPWECEDQEIVFKRDFTRWKQSDGEGMEPILLTVDFEFNAARDFSLVTFVDRFTEKNSQTQHKEPSDTRTLHLEITINPQDRESKAKVEVDGDALDELASQEVFAKIRTATTLVFHDSTATHHRYYRPRVHGYIEDLPTHDQDNLRKKQKTLTNAMKKVLERQRAELTSLIGRLGEKYEIDLSMPDVSFLSIPFGISLGEKDFAIPLDEWGSGTRNQTLILKRMFDARRAAENPTSTDRLTPVMIVEEPEAFLHPLAQARFGRVLQDLAGELQIQILATTHSPYMLSHKEPTANVLLSRRVHRKIKLRETQHVPTSGPDWKKPYEHALGVIGPEFDLFREAIFTSSNAILLVEGEIDKSYLEMLMGDEHGSSKLDIPGEIYSYGGWSTLQNNVLLKFIKERFSVVVVTVDLDAVTKVEKSLEHLGFEKDKSFIPVGLDQPGKRFIEGLLPDDVKQSVRARNAELINAMESDDKDEVKKAKESLKKLYLEEFRKVAVAGRKHFGGLYSLATKINKTLSDLTKRSP